jgi:hypothetical protein
MSAAMLGRKRFEEFALSLHPEKTRLIEFGRYAVHNREQKGPRQAGDLQLSGLYVDLRQNPPGSFPA